ncbi:MAG: heparin lyase I family protein [Nonlabens sp.]
MRFFHVLFITLLLTTDSSVEGVVLLEADRNQNTYDLINNVLAPGYDVVEVSDCSHPSFGDHITQKYDEDLGKDVFVFHGHVKEDSDRCKRFDKQRTEIKTYGNSPESTLGVQGETHIYEWYFKLDEGFQASAGYTHIHQIKAVGGPQDKMPTITYTLRDKNDKKTFSIRYAKDLNQEDMKTVDLEPFLGEWIHAREEITYGEEGSLEITLSRKRDNKELLSYKDDLRMWKDDARFLRPKWGLYRRLKHAEQLRDEQVLFADFKITEL